MASSYCRKPPTSTLRCVLVIVVTRDAAVPAAAARREFSDCMPFQDVLWNADHAVRIAASETRMAEARSHPRSVLVCREFAATSDQGCFSRSSLLAAWM
jgi:hypothetical protein